MKLTDKEKKSYSFMSQMLYIRIFMEQKIHHSNSPCTDFAAPHALMCQADRGRFEGASVHEGYRSLCHRRKDVNEEMDNLQNLMLPIS
jgi:hypothetical protein